MYALALALGSSLCWGVADFIGGVQSRKSPLLGVVLVSQAVGLVGLLVWVAARGQPPPDLVRLLPAAGAGLGGVVALACFYRALAIGTMSIVAPISATGVVVPVVVGLASGERPAALQVVGIATAVVGVVLASREGSGRPAAAAAVRRSILLALCAAVGFGTFMVGLRAGARADVSWALLAARLSAVVAVGALAWARGLAAVSVRAGFMPLAIMGCLDLTANALYAVASRHGALSIVAVVASLYPLATVLLARVVLGERVRRVQEAGIVAALTGVALIAAG
jgi:drug/metabolite transporter (DMT)-like permease